MAVLMSKAVEATAVQQFIACQLPAIVLACSLTFGPISAQAYLAVSCVCQVKLNQNRKGTQISHSVPFHSAKHMELCQ